MKSMSLNISVLGVLILSLCYFYGCDAKHTLIEAFSQNGAETKLIAFDATDNLGQSVAISGNVALVGASFSAYIYRWDESVWKKEANLTNKNEESYPWVDYSGE